MRTKGTLSSNSQSDDYPLVLLQLPFQFPFFGSTASSLAINPNGLLTLPPISDCKSFFGHADCITYSTFSNVISLWAKDWDLGVEKDSDVYYRFSSKQDGASDGASDPNDIDTFHIIYSNIYRYSKDVSTARRPSTFSASLHSDGSIRIRYHQISESVIPTDVAGLWGSRATNTDGSFNRYYNENITTAIASGNDVVFCPIFQSLSCAPDACVTAGGVFSVHWQPPSCSALHSSVPPQYKCSWGNGGKNGLIETAGVANGTLQQMFLQCRVPKLNLTDGTVVRVDILQGQCVVRVDILRD